MALFDRPADYINLDGDIVPQEEAKIHVLSPAVKYGASVFEGICAYLGDDGEEVNIFRLREHLVRLQQSMHIMRFDEAYALGHLTETVLELVRANALRVDHHIRLHAYVLGLGQPDATGPISLMCGAMHRSQRTLEDKAMRAGVSSWRRIDDTVIPPRLKCAANYQNSRLGKLQAMADGYNDVIFLTTAGKVSESSGSCLFMVRDGAVATPAVTHSILESITRATLIELFEAQLGMPVAQREIDRTELYIAEEVLLCGSGYEVTPVIDVDGFPVGDGAVGPITRRIWDTYEGVVRGRIAHDPAWLTPVYGAAAEEAIAAAGE